MLSNRLNFAFPTPFFHPELARQAHAGTPRYGHFGHLAGGMARLPRPAGCAR
ncbi:hypothetical protein [uncultured Hymenobacter sp.]|uniref:hypothetical protein n=1 Tax=uncultured Hymenobacter sp. TaxID=170016 RepID=UPI0035C98D56